MYIHVFNLAHITYTIKKCVKSIRSSTFTIPWNMNKNWFPRWQTSGMARVGAGEWVPAPQILVGRLVGVSKNNGTPKSSILIGFSIINHPFGVPLFLEIPLCWIWCFTLRWGCYHLEDGPPTKDTWLCKGGESCFRHFEVDLPNLRDVLLLIQVWLLAPEKKLASHWSFSGEILSWFGWTEPP